MWVSMGRREKLHESGLTVHQLNEPHTADKDDERNNDDSGGANRGLFLDAFSLPAVYGCMSEYTFLYTDLFVCVQDIYAGMCKAALMQGCM